MLRNKRRLIKLAGLLAALGVLVALIALAITVYLRNRGVTLPAPTGPYAVGRTLTEWTDTTRPETLGSDTNQPRALTVWLWYPADPPQDSTPAAYLPPAWAHARDHTHGIGSILFQSTRAIHAHAVADAPVSAAQTAYPVLIFEPGLGPTVSDYTTLLEDLASHGYVIIAVNPTYSSAAVVFADGHIVEQSTAGGIPDNASVAETAQIAGRLVQVWAGDMIFAMDQAQRLNADPDSAFAGRLDLNRIGVFGHSFGGAAAAEACHLDTRCTAGADLDGYPYGDVVQTGLAQPFLFVWSAGNDSSDVHYKQALRDIDAIYSRLTTGYQITIHGARHFNFTDNAVEFAPVLKVLGLLGSIDGARGLTISRAAVLAFFDTTLNGADPAPLRGLAATYPEISMESRGE